MIRRHQESTRTVPLFPYQTLVRSTCGAPRGLGRMSEAVRDASALLAWLKEEAGAGKVADAIAASRMTSVNYAEVVSHFIHAGMPAGEVDAMLHPLPMIIVEADQALANIAR